MPATRIQQVSYFLAALALFFILYLHLLPALLAGLLVYELVRLAVPYLESHLSNQRARVTAVALLAIFIGSAVIVTGVASVSYIHSDGGLTALAGRMADIIEHARQSLPDWLVTSLPESADGIEEAAANWLRIHASEVQTVGKEAGITVAHILVGLVIGALVTLGVALPDTPQRPLAAALATRVQRLAQAFRRIVFAQLRVSALNTFFSAAYLAVLLPLLGVHLPLTKTLIALTFVTGLLPVVGNLISNTVIVVVSLSHSPQIALASLAYLVVIHKLEYFLNARIVGAQISAKAWELLLAMLVMEAAFGLPGVVAAPIYYAYLKHELASAELV